MKVKQQDFLASKVVQQSHNKVKEIQYNRFQTQEYMTTPLLTNQ